VRPIATKVTAWEISTVGIGRSAFEGSDTSTTLDDQALRRASGHI
jgi:hypothetical protein